MGHMNATREKPGLDATTAAFSSGQVFNIFFAGYHIAGRFGRLLDSGSFVFTVHLRSSTVTSDHIQHITAIRELADGRIMSKRLDDCLGKMERS
jgi:hypothetical protein